MIQHLHALVDRYSKPESLRSLVLFLVIFLSLVFGVANAVRGLERQMLWPAIWIGLPLGWILAHPRISSWMGALVGSLVSISLTFLRVTDQEKTIGRIIQESLGFVWRTLRQKPAADATALQTALAELFNAQWDLIDRIMIWFQANLTDQALYTYDPIVVALIWGLLLWGLSVWAGWAIRRREQPLVSVLPAVATLTVILAFVIGRIIFLMPMVVAMFMLKAQFEQEQRQTLWEKMGFKFSSNIPKEINKTALAASTMVVIVAAMMPSIYASRIVEMLWDISREGEIVDDISRALGLEPRAISYKENPFSTDALGVLPRDHLINAAPELNQQVVMTVAVQEFQPTGPYNKSDWIAQAYYWRGITYDRYTGRGWSMGDLQTIDYDAGEYIAFALSGNYRAIRQEVQFIDHDGGLIYVAGDLEAADRNSQVTWRVNSNTQEIEDIIGATIDESNASNYRADSLLPVFGEDDLRAAGLVYPIWLIERYLALPEALPERVYSLANDLTVAETNPYDQAIAIEYYLRNFPYTLDVPLPPTDRDISDYFLFDLQKGYCDYYATTMVVLARAVGLPARLATGYIGGSSAADEAKYVVTEDLAHSWAQIYFPEFGWIDFEPTAGRDPIIRPVGTIFNVVPVVREDLEPILTQRTRANWRLVSSIGLGLLLSALGIAGIWYLVDFWRLWRNTPAETIKTIFQRLYRYGQWLNTLAQHGITPSEYSNLLINQISDLKNIPFVDSFLMQANGEIRLLTSLHNRASYSPSPLNIDEQKNAIKIWLQLRRRLIVAWLQQVAMKIRYN